MNRQQQSPPATYEGRPLVRPDDEIVDQGLGFDVDTLMGRRRMLRTLGLGVAAIGLAACGSNAVSGPTSSAAATARSAASDSSAASAASSSASGSSSSTAATVAAAAEIPDQTAGPYPGDGSNGPDVLEQSGIVRSDIRSSIGASSGTAEGVPMNLALTVTDLANGGVPFAGVAVYVWHCDRDGGYSMYSQGVEDQNYLRGVQVADANGVVNFSSIFPACYSGRWPHIHFEVYPDQAGITDASSAIATSQVALPQDVCQQVYAQPGYEASAKNLSQVSLQSDNVFGDDGGVSQLATVTGGVATGYSVSLAAGSTPPPRRRPVARVVGPAGCPGPLTLGEPTQLKRVDSSASCWLSVIVPVGFGPSRWLSGANPTVPKKTISQQ
jgi:protocatechuate 3,4-dioxygenase beta subunit